MQLEATLHSLLLHCRDFESAAIKILCMASTRQHANNYVQLSEEYAQYANIEFISEKDFRSDVMSLLPPCKYLLFLVDDNIFVRHFTLRETEELVDQHPNALGVSLRLGRNTTYCYSLDKPQKLPEFYELGNEHLKYIWTSAEHDFGYALELSSSVYRVADMLPLLSTLDFSNPNTLESALAACKGRFSQSHPHLICFTTSVTFCAPVNIVQTGAENRAASADEFSASNLSERFTEGYRVNIARLCGLTPNACHQEIRFELLDPSHEPLVSVVIPCYNQAHFLAEAVESVVMQTYRNWECLIVNDGSTDNTSSVAKQLIARFPSKKIKLIDKSNGGLSDARNCGIMAANGTYILPLDADDMVKPQMIEVAANVLKNTSHISIAYTDAIDFGASNGISRTVDYDFERLKHEGLFAYCALYPKNVWQEVGGYNSNMVWGYEDWDFWVGCGERGYFGQRIQEPLFMYRIKSESMITTARQHDNELKARLILNHQRIYTQEQVAWAHDVLVGAYEACALDPGLGKIPQVYSATPEPNAMGAVSTSPLVSVVIPTYNRERLLPRAISSVLAQTIPDFELLIVDDGSEDNTAQVVAGYSDKRIRYLRHPINQGQNAALNSGVGAATGTYVAFLDSDDEWLPDYLEQILRVFSTDQSLGAVYSRAGARTPDGELKASYPFTLSGNIYKEVLAQGYLSHMITLVVKRRGFETAGLFDTDFVVCQDDDFCFRVAKNFKVGLVPKILAIIHDDGGGDRVIKNSQRYAEGWWRLLAKYKDDVLALAGPDIFAGHLIKAGELFLKARNAVMAYKIFDIAVSFYQTIIAKGIPLPDDSLLEFAIPRNALSDKIIQGLHGCIQLAASSADLKLAEQAQQRLRVHMQMSATQ